MSERPIIFSAPMVRALLDGKKTQTRRVLARDPIACAGPETGFASIDVPRTPRWRKGDRLWVRETWAPVDACTHNDPGTQALADRGFYRADEAVACGDIARWNPSIHMPRWASRITLTVTDVRVQRLQDISDEDAVAEGIYWGDYDGWTSGRIDDASDYHASRPERSFEGFWCSLHGDDAWAKNPWVAALTFSVERRNIDEVPRV